MAIIYVNGKKIEVSEKDALDRDPPSREYSGDNYEDFYDIEKRVSERIEHIKKTGREVLIKDGFSEEEAKKCFSKLPDEIENLIRENIVSSINCLLERNLDECNFYKNYTDKKCVRLIKKYEKLVSEQEEKIFELERLYTEEFLNRDSSILDTDSSIDRFNRMFEIDCEYDILRVYSSELEEYKNSMKLICEKKNRKKKISDFLYECKDDFDDIKN